MLFVKGGVYAYVYTSLPLRISKRDNGDGNQAYDRKLGTQSTKIGDAKETQKLGSKL